MKTLRVTIHALLRARFMLVLVCQLVIAHLFALALGTSPTDAKCPIEPPPTLDVADQLQLIEKVGCFNQALDLLKQHSAELNGSQRAHLEHLRAFVLIQISNSDDKLLASDRSQALQDLLLKFDPVNDVYLLYAGRKELNDLDAKSVSIRGSRYGQFWSRVADSLGNKDVLSLPVSIGWVPFLVLVTVAYLLWRFWPRKGFLISFEDLTGESSSKPSKDRILTQEFQEAFWVPRVEHTFSGLDLRVFAINDHDGSSFATLIPQKTLVVWSDIMQAESPIKVGPIEFNLKQVLKLLLGWLQSPTRHALVGSLHQDEGQTVVAAQRLNRRRRLVPGFSWKLRSESGPHKQQDLIGDLAAQMLVDLGGTALTTSWRSYRRLLRGIESLDRRPPEPDSCNCFATARQHLWSALEEDPTNWMARFYLGIALRRCGANQEAARHFALVAQLFATAEKRLAARSRLRRRRDSNFLEKHLWDYPQCALIVLYNRAMALSKLHNVDDMERALRLLTYIIDLCDGHKPNSKATVHDSDIPEADGFQHSPRRLKEFERRRFACIARSAQTVVWAAQAEYLCPETVSPLKELLDRINLVEKHIRDAAAAGASQSAFRRSSHRNDSSSQNLALATVLCAKGKIQLHLGDSNAARDSFGNAILLAPNMVDAQLSLAASYVNDHGEGSSWIRAAEDALQQALRFDPTCPKAHYLLARLECCRRPPDYDQALKHLEKTEALPEAFLLRAEIYANAGFRGHDIRAAIAAWREGLDRLTPAVSADQSYQIERLCSIADHSKNIELQQLATQAASHISQNCPWQHGRWASRIGSPDRKPMATAATA